jgi:hypothetical protein
MPGRTMPVLILTARDNWHEKVAGIDAGADDYLTKPFHMEELLARVRGLIRRAAGQAAPVLRCGELALDTRSGRVTLGGQAVTLTSHEYKVLDYLMHRPGAVVSRMELIEHIYAQDFDRDSNTIEVFVGRLRKKLPPGLIETVRGHGLPPVAGRARCGTWRWPRRPMRWPMAWCTRARGGRPGQDQAPAAWSSAVCRHRRRPGRQTPHAGDCWPRQDLQATDWPSR